MPLTKISAATGFAVLLLVLSPGPSDAQNVAGERLNLDEFHETLRTADVLEYRTSSRVVDRTASRSTSGNSHVRIRRPNMFRADVRSGGRDRVFISDGTTLTILDQATGKYAQYPARRDILSTMNLATGLLAVEARVLDFLWTARYVDQDGGFRLVRGLGDVTVGGRSCQGFAVARDQDRWEVWFDRAGRRLPCRLVSQRRDGASEISQTNDFQWVDAPTFSDDIFVFVARKGARRVDAFDLE